ncbi:hypothetical protein ACQ4PT_005745 [Festuca glaucescens]
MEMAEAAPLSKKRKLGGHGSSEPEEISSRELAAAMEVPDSHIQQPLPGAEGAEEGVDRISGLPDAVLGDIISLLPTREDARTQTLASRWRHLWRSAPLNLDYDDLPAEGDVLIELISQILSAQAGSGRRLCISAHHLCHHPATVDAWLRSPALGNLQELEFCRAANHPPTERDGREMVGTSSYKHSGSASSCSNGAQVKLQRLSYGRIERTSSHGARPAQQHRPSGAALHVFVEGVAPAPSP